MSICQLNSLIDDIESCIRHYSACLVTELAAREELDYEQELKDLFFTRLHEIQSRIDGVKNVQKHKLENHCDDDESEEPASKRNSTFLGELAM